MFKDNQEFFDAVVTHLRKQGCQAVRLNEYGFPAQCCYRMEKDGKILACAIGGIIPNALYNPEMEGKNAFTLLADYPNVADLVINVSRALIAEIQNVHDCHSPYKWECDFRRLADCFFLTYKEPEQVS